jgi:VIT1/CCC1 family predicted Fe2+/Mn2+ transporter
MSDNLVTALVSIVLAIISLAALATILSPHAQTSTVIRAGSQGLATDITAAVSPVTGGGFGLSAPSLSNGFG